jgi:hypothetical protein
MISHTTSKRDTRCIQKDNYFFEYVKASIADLFTLLSSSVQNSEGGGDSDSFADPCQEFKQGFLWVSSGLPLV